MVKMISLKVIVIKLIFRKTIEILTFFEISFVVSQLYFTVAVHANFYLINSQAKYFYQMYKRCLAFRVFRKKIRTVKYQI